MRYYYETGGYERFKEAQRTYIRSSLQRRLWFHFSMWGMLLVGIILALLYFGVGQSHNYALVFILGAGFIVGGVVTPLLRALQLQRMYSTLNSNKIGRAYIEVDGPILISGIEGRAEGRFERPSVCNVVEDDTLLLFFLGKKRFMYFPKQALSPEAISDLRTWLDLPGAPWEC
jgi:hypothetical protein